MLFWVRQAAPPNAVAHYMEVEGLFAEAWDVRIGWGQFSFVEYGVPFFLGLVGSSFIVVSRDHEHDT